MAENFALNTRGAHNFRRFSSPDLASLKCHAFLGPTPKRAANISDLDLALFCPQFHF